MSKSQLKHSDLIESIIILYVRTKRSLFTDNMITVRYDKNSPVSQLFSHEIKFSRSKFSEDTSWIGLANVLHNIDVLQEYISLETGVQASLDRSKKNGNQQTTASQTAAIFLFFSGVL